MPRTEFGDGVWQVGVDIEPGIYVAASPTEDAWWERLGDFTGEKSLAFGSANDAAQLIVEIRSTDAGFKSEGCGTWRKRS